MDMTIIYIAGALLWTYVLLAVLLRLTEQRRARRTWQANRAEAERAWQEREAERAELVREMQHAVTLAKLEGWTK